MSDLQEADPEEAGVLVNPLDLDDPTRGSNGGPVLGPGDVQGSVALGDGADHAEALPAGQVLRERERLHQGRHCEVVRAKKRGTNVRSANWAVLIVRMCKKGV